VLHYTGSGIETTFTEGEDECLRALVPRLPAARGGPELLVVGSMADVIEDQFVRLFDALGIGPVRFFPPRRYTDLPSVGPETRVIAAQPWLNGTLDALESRGATVIPSTFPLGARGTLRWFRAVASAWDVPKADVDRVLAAPYARALAAQEAYRPDLEGRRISFFPDSQIEISLARCLREEVDMEPVEVATPYLHRRRMAAELALLPDSVRLVEGQHVDRQLDRALEDEPDLVVCGLGLANPLEARGLTTKWAIELVFTPIQGFEQAGDLMELFARPIRRRARLEV
jgi:light-independent protochlorophyllide reductase subunit N